MITVTISVTVAIAANEGFAASIPEVGLDGFNEGLCPSL
jgi:hypothetical protein